MYGLTHVPITVTSNVCLLEKRLKSGGGGQREQILFPLIGVLFILWYLRLMP
jgi:hypothetical protein